MLVMVVVVLVVRRRVVNFSISAAMLHTTLFITAHLTNNEYKTKLPKNSREKWKT